MGTWEDVGKRHYVKNVQGHVLCFYKQYFLCVFLQTNLIGELAKGKECAILSVSQSLNESFSAEVNPHSIELCVEKCSTEKALSCVSSAVTLSLSISEVSELL